MDLQSAVRNREEISHILINLIKRFTKIELAYSASLTPIEDQIVDGVTTKAPSQNAVYDALLTKASLSDVTSMDNALQIQIDTKANIAGQIFTGDISAPNLSGTNTGDETTSSIQTKRPLKTIEGQSLEGVGDIDLNKSDVGLSNVDNTSDLNKPISTATQTALNLKEDKVNKGVPLGYTPLDSNNKVPLVHINDALLGNVNITTIPTWSAGTYDINKVVKYLKDGIYYTFVSQINGNVSEPQLIKSTQPYTAITGTLIGVWNSGTAYVNSNIVTYNGYVYQCITNNTNQNPELLAPPYWIKLGYDAGVWSGASTYHAYNVVSVGTSVYRSNLNENTFGVATIKNHYWDEIKENSVQVDAWGDSLTFGSGASLNASYTNALSFTSGLNIINFGVPGETSTQIKNRFVARPDLYKNAVVIWAGRNNYASTATVEADIATMVGLLGHNRYLILGITKSRNESVGSQDAINNALKATYKDQFLDIQSYLVQQYNPLVPQDVIDYAAKNIPFSIRADWVHLNDNGYALVAKLINSYSAYLLGDSKKTVNTLTSTGLRVTGNNTPLELTKGLELGYRTDNDFGFIQSYDRVTSVVKPLSISYSAGSLTKINENGGVLLVGKPTSDGINNNQFVGNTINQGRFIGKSDAFPIVAQANTVGAAVMYQIQNSIGASRGYFGYPTASSTNMFINNSEGDTYIIAKTGNSIILNNNTSVNGNTGIGINTAPTANLHIAASTTEKALMRLTVGPAPTTPNNGDVWLESNTNTGLKIRIAGVTKTISLV